MKNIFGGFWYFAILLLAVEQWWFWCFLAVGYFTWKYGAVWLISVGFLLDVYFGNFYAVPYFSLGAIFWYLIFDIARSYLMNVR